MPVLIGQFVGGLIAIYLLSLLWEFLLFKRVLDDPVKGKLSSVAVAWLTAGTLGGFGFADGGPYAWQAFGIYFVPALIVGGFAYRSGLKLREDADDE
ncbi:MAG: hypothetical protein V4574_11645 [Pseudomonadota bacterium]